MEREELWTLDEFNGQSGESEDWRKDVRLHNDDHVVLRCSLVTGPAGCGELEFADF